MNEIRIELEDEKTAFEPGAEISGRVVWRTEEAPEKVLVSLLWHTAGKGTEDIEIVEQETFEGPATTGEYDFSFRLPDFPWSFSGTLISLVWAVEASLEPGGGVAQVEVVSAPGAAEVRI